MSCYFIASPLGSRLHVKYPLQHVTFDWQYLIFFRLEFGFLEKSLLIDI